MSETEISVMSSPVLGDGLRMILSLRVYVSVLTNESTSDRTELSSSRLRELYLGTSFTSNSSVAMALSLPLLGTQCQMSVLMLIIYNIFTFVHLYCIFKDSLKVYLF